MKDNHFPQTTSNRINERDTICIYEGEEGVKRGIQDIVDFG